jgi:hypothetical protein
MEQAKVKALYSEAVKIAEQLGVTDEVVAEMNPPPYEDAFCWALGNVIFCLNDQKDPTTKLVNDRITPKMVNWYVRQLEVMAT